MTDIKLLKISKLIDQKKIEEAQNEIAILGPHFHKNTQYLYLRSKIFFINKLYYLAIDTLLVALEFEQKEEIYKLLSQIYQVLENKSLSKNFLDPNLRLETTNSLKNELSGIYRKKL